MSELERTRAASPAIRTPRSAAYAGIVFASLLAVALIATHFAHPQTPADARETLITSPQRELILGSLALVPFAAVAFLWFVGVLRHHVGDREDKLFATVFLGSGLLFVGVLLVAEAMTTGMVLSATRANTFAATTPDWWIPIRNISGQMLDAALQMAAVFTTAAAALLARTNATHRWLAISGRVLSVVLFVGVFFTKWIGLLFPLWVLALSLAILKAARQADAGPSLSPT